MRPWQVLTAGTAFALLFGGLVYQAGFDQARRIRAAADMATNTKALTQWEAEEARAGAATIARWEKRTATRCCWPELTEFVPELPPRMRLNRLVTPANFDEVWAEAAYRVMSGAPREIFVGDGLAPVANGGDSQPSFSRAFTDIGPSSGTIPACSGKPKGYPSLCQSPEANPSDGHLRVLSEDGTLLMDLNLRTGASTMHGTPDRAAREFWAAVQQLGHTQNSGDSSPQVEAR